MIQIRAILKVKLYMFSHLCGLGLLPIIPHTKDAGPVGSRSNNNNNNNNNFIGTQPKIKLNEQELLKVYMTDLFFICLIESPQCADKCSKNIFLIAIFLPRVLMCQKRQISLPVGYKTATPKTGDWEQL